MYTYQEGLFGIFFGCLLLLLVMVFLCGVFGLVGVFFFMFMLWVVYFCRSARMQIPPFISQSESTCLCFIITVYNYFFCHLASSLDLLGYNSLFFYSHLV